MCMRSLLLPVVGLLCCGIAIYNIFALLRLLVRDDVTMQTKKLQLLQATASSNRATKSDSDIKTLINSVYEQFANEKADENATTIDDTTSNFAYVYVIGGCNPAQPAYRGYIYNILVSTFHQRKYGTTADIIVYFQLMHKLREDKLPDRDTTALQKMGIQVRYLPKSHDESFYSIMLEKFQVLQLTKYSRVMYLDGDVTILNNIDYLFQLSQAGVMNENLIFQGVHEPAQGGLFMLSPTDGDYDLSRQIILDTEARGRELPYPYWNESAGWGQVIPSDDPWYTLKGAKGTKWDYYGAYVDQGLLYHWVKYVKKSYSYITRDTVENRIVDANGKEHTESSFPLKLLSQFTHVKDCWKGQNKFRACLPPHTDFMHYTGRSKPWLGNVPNGTERSDSLSLEASIAYWFQILSTLDGKLGLQIGLPKYWSPLEMPLLGIFPRPPMLY